MWREEVHPEKKKETSQDFNTVFEGMGHLCMFANMGDLIAPCSISNIEECRGLAGIAAGQIGAADNPLTDVGPKMIRAHDRAYATRSMPRFNLPADAKRLGDEAAEKAVEDTTQADLPPFDASLAIPGSGKKLGPRETRGNFEIEDLDVPLYAEIAYKWQTRKIYSDDPIVQMAKCHLDRQTPGGSK